MNQQNYPRPFVTSPLPDVGVASPYRNREVQMNLQAMTLLELANLYVDAARYESSLYALDAEFLRRQKMLDEAAGKDAEWAAKITATDDTEVDHVRAGDVLCELLASLGFHKTVGAFRGLKKWYA